LGGENEKLKTNGVKERQEENIERIFAQEGESGLKGIKNQAPLLCLAGGEQYDLKRKRELS
jgi:hypothetical protein